MDYCEETCVVWKPWISEQARNPPIFGLKYCSGRSRRNRIGFAYTIWKHFIRQHIYFFQTHTDTHTHTHTHSNGRLQSYWLDLFVTRDGAVWLAFAWIPLDRGSVSPRYFGQPGITVIYGYVRNLKLLLRFWVRFSKRSWIMEHLTGYCDDDPDCCVREILVNSPGTFSVSTWPRLTTMMRCTDAAGYKMAAGKINFTCCCLVATFYLPACLSVFHWFVFGNFLFMGFSLTGGVKQLTDGTNIN